ncbi:MAG: hypothetical protein RBS16_01130 [Candidatus Cloacimonadales bacterium]|nr:hypothetical protein [Candidatus Cloacimonadales bacterium]
MTNKKLWRTEDEKRFFDDALKSFASPEQLFYNLESDYYAFIPKKRDAKGQTLQSRNSLIGKFTEKWAKTLLAPIAKQHNLYAVNGVVCEEIGLPKISAADLAFCTKDGVMQNAEDIKIIFEIKMSIVSNYRLDKTGSIAYIGDYKTHKGAPSLLRSDSMLKAIGKAVNIRVAGIKANKIPIIVLGNSPISNSYISKVDTLKVAGIIQGFWSLNPKPTNTEFVKCSPKKAFQTIENYVQLREITNEVLLQNCSYFSSMISESRLGEIIRLANSEKSDEDKAAKFLCLLRKGV